MSFRGADERALRAFAEECSDYLTGDVLDFGCGRQPYRDLVEAAGGTYHAYDRRQFPGNASGEDFGWNADEPRLQRYDAIICTEVVNYLPDPAALLRDLRALLLTRQPDVPNGFLILTGRTNWPLAEKDDLHRYTTIGARDLLIEAGYRVRRLVGRAAVLVEDEEWSLGWAALAEPL